MLERTPMKESALKKFIIQGPVKIQGEVQISGAKNAALPILAATLLATKPIKLQNIPKLLDIISMLESLCYLGSDICLNDDQSMTINNAYCREKHIEESLKKTRASILLLGPLLARFGKATIAMPGGCNIGERPIDIHIDSLIKLGASITINNGIIQASAPNGLQGTTINLPKPSVGATENLIMAATLANGTTTVNNSAIEPEIFDLIDLLNSMGAKITHNGTKTLIIEGVSELSSCEHSIIGDRIEAGTYLIAAAATQGTITVKQVNPQHLSFVLEKLTEAGASIQTTEDSIHLDMPQQPKAVNISTMPFPGFPTDLQAQWLALNIVANGESSVIDTIYETRISHVSELMKIGAQLTLTHNKIIAKGNSPLQGKHINATDIRASAGLIIAALCTHGETHIHNTTFTDRGYVALEEKLRKLGAIINRTKAENIQKETTQAK